MRSKLGGIVRRNAKTIIILGFLTLPVMALFQNCGKTQGIGITDVTPNSKSSVVDSANLPLGDTQIDQIGSASGTTGDSSEVISSGGSSGVVSSGDSSDDSDTISIDIPGVEEQEEQEIEDSLAACAALENSSESNNINGSGVFSSDHKSASNINGKHVLSSANFDGNTQIVSISNSHGSLTICGLDVETLSNYNGKVTLVNNSKIGVINSLNGRLVILDGSSAKLRNSKVMVKKIR